VNSFFVMLAAVILSPAAFAGEARTINSLAESGWREHAGECCESGRDRQLDSKARFSNGAALPEPQMSPETQKAKRRSKPPVAPKEGDKAPLMVSFTELKWIELPERKGMQFATLSGDPKNGAYTQMRKVPAGTDNPLHAHSSEIKNVIISGIWYTGVDAASARDFGPGSIVMMPANWVHVSGCRSGSDCLFYQEGKGKFDFKPVAAKGSDPKPNN
jgi:quercetin dioxygenase-like cupin family protein